MKNAIKKIIGTKATPVVPSNLRYLTIEQATKVTTAWANGEIKF